MPFGTTPVSTTSLGTNQFPASSVAVPGHANGDLTALRGANAATDSNGNELADASVAVANGADVAQGNTTDAAVTGDNAGTLSAKLRGLSKILTDIWDSVNHRLHVNVDAGSITANAGTNLNTSTLALESGGNLATLAGIVSSSKAAMKAASGDFADGAITTLGNKTDAKSTATDATSISIMAVLKEISAMAQAPASTPVTGTFWQATQPVSGTVTANAGTNLNTSTLALESGGHLANIDTHTPALGQATKANSSPVVIASDQGDLFIKGDFTEQASLSAGSLNADLVPSTDISAYNEWVLQVGAIAGGGTLTFQGSNDNSTFVSILAFNAGSTAAPSATTSATGIFYGPRLFRYLRVRQTAWTSGSTTGTLELYTATSPFIGGTLNVGQSGTWTVQPGNTANTVPWLTQGPTSTGTQAANTAGNTVIKGSAGALWSATVTTLGTAGLDIFDNASTNAGVKLLSIPASAPVGTIYAFPAGQPAANGIVSAGVTNCPAVTFSIR